MILFWLLSGMIGYALIKAYHKDYLLSLDLELDLAVLMFTCLGLISLLCALNLVLKNKI